MFTRQAAFGVAFIALVAAGLSGCAGSKPGASNASSSTTGSPRPEVSVRYDQNAALSLAIGPDPGQWNCDAAGLARADCLAVVDRIWPSVYRLDANGNPQLDQTFVESATQTSHSPQTVVYRLNPKATWSDGTPITYRDFVYNWQAQSGSPVYHDVGGAAFAAAQHQGYNDIASVTGSNQDPDVVTVVFASPYPDWQSLFGAGDPLVPAQVAQKVGYDGGFVDPVQDLVSAGPYSVQSYTRGDGITLVRNPLYWGGPANLASLTFRFVGDPAELAPGLRAGEIGAAVVTPTPGVGVAREVLTAVKSVGGVNVSAQASETYQQLDFNQANPFLADPVLRHAIMLAVPRAMMLKRFAGSTDASIGLLENRFFTPGSAGYKDNSGGAYDAVDLTQARQILTTAGYLATADAPLTKNGQAVSLRITSMSGEPALAGEEQIVVGALASLGITVTETDSPMLAATLAQGNFDLAIDTATAGPFLSANDATYHSGGAANVDKASDPQVDVLLAQVDATFDRQRRQNLYNQVDRALWADFQSVPLFQVPAIVASQNNYLDAAASRSIEGPLSNLDQWGVASTS